MLFLGVYLAIHALVVFAACATDLLISLPWHQDWEHRIFTAFPGQGRLALYGFNAMSSSLGSALVAPVAFGFRFPFTALGVGVVGLASGLVAGAFLGQTVRLLLYVRLSPAADMAIVGALAGLVGGICSMGLLAVVMPSSRGA